MPKQIAIIVSNYNGKRYLKDCFESLFAQTYQDCEIYLLDNASSDGSVEYTTQFFPTVKILAMEKNYGFAEGYNKAIERVDSEYIAMVNNDTKTDPRWLENLMEVFREYPDAAMAGSKIYFLEKPRILNCAGKKLTYSGTGFDIGYGLKDNERFDKRKLVGGLCGASMLVKREVFRQLGGFDTDYFLLCEDTDLCWRAWLSGYKVIYEPASVIYHRFGECIGKRESPLRIFYSQRNAILTLIKNLGALRLVISLNIVLAYTLVKLVLYALLLKKGNFVALFKGTIAVVPLLRKAMAKRYLIQKQRKIPDRFLEKNGLMASLKEALSEYLRVTKLWLAPV